MANLIEYKKFSFINIDDHFFDSLKEDYPEFEELRRRLGFGLRRPRRPDECRHVGQCPRPADIQIRPETRIAVRTADI